MSPAIILAYQPPRKITKVFSAVLSSIEQSEAFGNDPPSTLRSMRTAKDS